jgi:phage terminase large subunit GpA-like protein
VIPAVKRPMRLFAPPPQLKLSAWIEANIRLPQGTNAVPGPMRLWPWQHAIADAISDDSVARVTLLKAARVGFTSLTVGAIGAYIANEPSSILCLLPTESDARDFVVSDIEPTFAASPALAHALSPDREEGQRDTLTSRRFAGGSLKVVAAKAPRNLRRHTCRILIVDEADACEAGAEGDPLSLAERRTLTFPNRKIIVGSTPIYADVSPIMRSFAESDQGIFEVPCPSCGAFFEIMWKDIVWPEGDPEAAMCQCPHCAEKIDERQKSVMVHAGRWRALRPDVQGHRGFRLNSLVSLLSNASWAKLAALFINSKDVPERLQTFVNTVFGEGWSSPSLVDQGTLAARAEPFDTDHVPPEALLVTIGADLQDDRLEASVVAWTADGVMLVPAHETIWGNYQDQTFWREVDEFLRSEWRHPHGGRLRVDAAIIDASDGDHFPFVIDFCFPRRGRRVSPARA